MSCRVSTTPSSSTWPTARRTHSPRLLQCFSTSPLHLWALQPLPWGPWLNLAPLNPSAPASCSTRRDVAISATGMDGLLRAPRITALLWEFVLEFWSFYLLIECFVTILRWILRYCWKICCVESWFAYLARGSGKAETRFCAWPLHL